MKMLQKEFKLKLHPRGFHLITNDIMKNIEDEIKDFHIGTLNLFIKHTSASLSINENCDSSVRSDMEVFFNDVVSNKSYFEHTYEGDDDMPAHIKSSILGCSLTIPITNRKLNLGTWQGIYLGEHRNFGGARTIVATIIGE
ncbi:secondary thiamine-phosphate synthase enzyme YjbQ [Halarcobacter ebronensis]|uniref:Secondary thiamine-phosphate synthase n=1 Tax=Halarcobacter ebronensis TaxID=1462615 RepID=A0A4Q1AQN8_9BACT|nr:secondary thiamine-phosphate synthase enzyme YjbQ [Halarcobacter ebronensis]QKF81340.1 putative thiamine phosphate synthase YjbQ [Halarcobacter ebronensis]RXK04902.1 secondary thiamine-phosphate synthase [Halarcobacter ebronensis]